MANILLVTHIYPPATDGGSKVIAKIGDHLQSHGHQTMVLTSNCSSTDDFISARRSQMTLDEVGPHSHQSTNVPMLFL